MIDNTRELGCTDLAIGKSFSVLIGDSLNRLHFALRYPITSLLQLQLNFHGSF